MPVYMKLGDIKGESQAHGFQEWFDIFAFSMGASNSSASGGGGGSGKVIVHDINLTKPSGAGSPALFLACCKGEHFGEALLTVTRASDGEPFMQYRFENVLVSSHQTSGDGGSIPTESISLNFEKITYRHTVFDVDGSIKRVETMFWDVARNIGA